MSSPTPPPLSGVGLDELLRALDSAVVELVVPPPQTGVRVTSVMLVDADDLSGADLGLDRPADVCLLAGVPAAAVLDWLHQLASRDPALRPQTVLSKAVSGSPAWRRAAQHAGVALVAVNAQARVETLLAAVRGLLDRSSTPAGEGQAELHDAGTDLFGLARTVAALTNGMVSIEDERSRVLAYSASDDAADEVRRLSILGREGPPDYLRQLRERGVFERLRRSDDVVQVPGDPALGLQRRLVVSIRPLADPADHQRRAPILGAIWVQEGRQPLSTEAEPALRGASAVAARLISRSRNAPNNEAIQIQRLLGALGGGVDVPSLAAALSISTAGPAVVIGLDTIGGAQATPVSEVAATLRLHASAYARESLVAAIGDRLYVLLPRTPSPARVPAWTEGVIERIAAHSGVALRAAVAAPVALAGVSAARLEVDRVLDATEGDQRVTTLADSRTPVLLGEIADLIATRDDLRDPRLDTLVHYDVEHSSALVPSVEEYLLQFGDVRRAAAALQIHPNTLRYRIGRAEQILDLDLSDPAARLLVELQLMVRRRNGR